MQVRRFWLVFSPFVFLSLSCFAGPEVHFTETQTKVNTDWRSSIAVAKDEQGDVLSESYKITVNLEVEPAESDQSLQVRMWEIIRKDLSENDIGCDIGHQSLAFSRTDEFHSVGVIEVHCEPS